jgi:hypothetical protein
MDLFTQHFFEWFILILVILGAIYTLKVIGEEKATFKDESYLVEFGNLQLMIPKWWSITEHNSQSIRFERTDTRYDWYAKFSYFPNNNGKSIPQLLEEKLNLEEIEFDMDVVFETDSRVTFRDSEIQNYFQEMTRVEGKGSKNVVDRIYYDIYIMKGLDDSGYFIFESMSSVLNGLLEGPYFEESISELSFVRKT